MVEKNWMKSDLLAGVVAKYDYNHGEGALGGCGRFRVVEFGYRN